MPDKIRIANFFSRDVTLDLSKEFFPDVLFGDIPSTFVKFWEDVLKFKDFEGFTEGDASELVRKYEFIEYIYELESFNESQIELDINSELQAKVGEKRDELSAKYESSMVEAQIKTYEKNYKKLLIELKKLEIVLGNRKRAEFFIYLFLQERGSFQYSIDSVLRCPLFIKQDQGYVIEPRKFLDVQVEERNEFGREDLEDFRWKNDRKNVAIIRLPNGYLLLDRRVRDKVRVFSVGDIEFDGAVSFSKSENYKEVYVPSWKFDKEWEDDEDIKKVLDAFMGVAQDFKFDYRLSKDKTRISIEYDLAEAELETQISTKIGKLRTSVDIDWTILDEGLNDENLDRFLKIDEKDAFIEFDKKCDKQMREKLGLKLKGEIDLLKEVFLQETLTYMLSRGAKKEILLPNILKNEYIASLKHSLIQAPKDSRVKLIGKYRYRIPQNFNEIIEMPKADVRLELPRDLTDDYLKSLQEAFRKTGEIKVQLMGCDAHIRKVLGEIKSLEGVEIEIILSGAESKDDIKNLFDLFENLSEEEKKRVTIIPRGKEASKALSTYRAQSQYATFFKPISERKEVPRLQPKTMSTRGGG